MVTYADAAHLLRRAGFGGTRAEVNALVPLSRAAMVERVLDPTKAAAVTRPAFLDDDALEEWEKGFRLRNWWFDRMRTSAAPLTEKMTLFWHGHFATSMDKVYDARAVYDQQNSFRTLGLGSFHTLTTAVSLQAAMLRYLDNDYSVVGSPNENFARELMELFTLGLDQNYTQSDIVEGARAWTGHNVGDNNPRQYVFYSKRHDNAPKTIFGITRNWNGPEMIDHIMTQEPHKTSAARLIARKVWSFFAYGNPEKAVLDALTMAFHDADLDITALLRAVFNHDAFYSDRARTNHFRSPTEWVVAAMRVANIRADVANPPWFMDDMGQQLLYPPNVAGWPNNGAFISSTASAARMNFARFLTWKWYQATPTAWQSLKTLSVNSAVDVAYRRFNIDRVSVSDQTRLREWLTAQRAASTAPAWEWDEWQNINLFTLMLLAPEFNAA
ncbi:MAG: DUF1800 domain-containing protein [Acidimicrobiia bacterium]